VASEAHSGPIKSPKPKGAGAAHAACNPRRKALLGEAEHPFFQKKYAVGAWTPRAHGAREGRVRGFLGGALRCLADSESPSPKKKAPCTQAATGLRAEGVTTSSFNGLPTCQQQAFLKTTRSTASSLLICASSGNSTTLLPARPARSTAPLPPPPLALAAREAAGPVHRGTSPPTHCSSISSASRQLACTKAAQSSSPAPPKRSG
jgi:hypothetical protein